MDHYGVDGVAAHQVRLQFEALLLAPLLKPLAGELQEAGEYGMDLFAREIAARLDAAP